MKWLICLLILSALMSGCSDIAYWELATFYKLDCRPEHLTPDGKCVPVKKSTPEPKGGGDVQTVARP